MILSIPEWLEPMAATLTQERFTGPEWIFERKFDGIRLLAFKNGRGRAAVLAQPVAAEHSLPSPRRSRACRSHDVILDGEVTWGQGRRAYHVFDILWLDGRDVTSLPLDARRALLNALPLRSPLQRVTALDDATPWERACREGWEGVIAKRRDSPYEHRRSPHWLKMKCELTQELVVGGFTDPQGDAWAWARCWSATSTTGRLRLCRQDRHGLRHEAAAGPARAAGRARDREAAVHEGVGLPRLRAHWVRPEIVVQVAFIEWTVHGKLRHPRLLGVRDSDKVRAARRSCANRRRRCDHAPREGAVSRRRDHQGRARGVLRGDRADHAAAHPRRVRSRWSGIRRGIGEKGFFQKDVSKGFPEWLERVEVPKKDGTVHHPIVADTRSLLWLANQNCITPHVWTSRAPNLYHPDICVFDLDPSAKTSRASCARRRSALRDLLRGAGPARAG